MEDTGGIATHIRDLEAKLEQAALRSNALNMERVLGDLKQIRAENRALANRLGVEE